MAHQDLVVRESLSKMVPSAGVGTCFSRRADGLGRDQHHASSRFNTHAYRQKARWTLGIGLQGWQQVGWTGSFATRYLLFRDRKGLVTSFIAILAYLLLANFFLFYLADRFGWWTVYYPRTSDPEAGW